jgi:hypothetical protein
MAYGAAEVLLTIDPSNTKAQEYVRHRKSDNEHVEGVPITDIQYTEETLEEGYRLLKIDANILKVELASDYFSNVSENQDKILRNLHEISKGNISSAISVAQPVSAREAARHVLTNLNKAAETIAEDFEEIIRWTTNQSGQLDIQKILERLKSRRAFLEAALPASVQQDIATAFRQVEREHLEKKYVNTETMYGDKIEDIPKANFFASEDNYAFDMEELARAIELQNGVMRNPLSRQMFSISDIQVIIRHPLGKKLKLLEEAQNRYKKGIRTATIDKIQHLGNAMLKDQSMDAGPSRKGINEFLAFVATLPLSEQTTLKQLKIPAVDKNTRQPFDYSIAESVSDAKSGATCYHKVRYGKIYSIQQILILQ